MIKGALTTVINEVISKQRKRFGELGGIRVSHSCISVSALSITGMEKRPIPNIENLIEFANTTCIVETLPCAYCLVICGAKALDTVFVIP